MNFSTYIFGSFGDGYSQYPNDYTQTIFKNCYNQSYAPIQIVVHRQDRIMYYSCIRKLDAGQYLGLSIVLNSVMLTDFKGLFSLFENVITSIANQGIILKHDDKGNVISVATKLSSLQAEISRIAALLYNGINRLEATSKSLPSISFDVGNNAIQYCSLEDANIDEMIQASATNDYTIICKQRVFLQPSKPKPPVYVIIAIIVVIMMVVGGIAVIIKGGDIFTKGGNAIVTGDSDSIKVGRTDAKDQQIKDILVAGEMNPRVSMLQRYKVFLKRVRVDENPGRSVGGVDSGGSVGVDEKESGGTVGGADSGGVGITNHEEQSGKKTIYLSYGTYIGEVKNGYPHGHGKLEYSTTRQINRTDVENRMAHAGQYIEGEFYNGFVYYGDLYDEDNSPLEHLTFGRVEGGYDSK